MIDGDLVRRVVAGETAAYGELVRRWFYRILAYCQSRAFAGSIHDAEDLAQEVFIRGFRDLAQLSDPDCYGPWIRGIASHVCADWGRNLRHRAVALQEPQSSIDSMSSIPFEMAETADERSFIVEQIASMPEVLREVILLHYYEELSYDEMAAWLGVARATVNERLAKARGLLRIRLAKIRSDV